MDYGLAFFEDGYGTRVHLANLAHLKYAVKNLNLANSIEEADWMTLETYTSTFIQCWQMNVYNGFKTQSLQLPRAELVLQQNEVGEIPANMLLTTTVYDLIQ